MKKTIIVTLALFFVIIARSQEDPSERLVGTQLKLGVNYNSTLNYYGRTDSLRSSGFFPMAELWFNEKFYINAAPVFVSNAMASFDYAGTIAAAGYLNNHENKWLTNIYFLKPFYEESSRLVQSALKAQAGLSLTKMSSVINLTAGADVKFSDKVDYGVTGGLDHIIRKQFADNSVLVIDPSAYVFAGTQQFTNTYYNKSDFILFPGFEQQVTENVKKFNVLSYEFSVPVIYAKEKFQFLLTPAYVVPQNLVTIEGRPELSEQGKSMLYVTLGAKLSL